MVGVLEFGMAKISLVYVLVFFMIFSMTTVFNNTVSFDSGGDVSTAAFVLDEGEYVLFGKYDDQPILWKCAGVDENGALMVSTKILCRKPYDVYSMENGSHVRRAIYGGLIGGSNYWGDSNIRSWLNSDAQAGDVVWLCGNPPAKDNIIHSSYGQYDYNSYDDEKGFLADGNFTQTERDMIKVVTQKSLLDKLDADLAVGGDKDAWGSGGISMDVDNFIKEHNDNICYEYTIDKVFLLDIKQYGYLSKQEVKDKKDKNDIANIGNIDDINDISDTSDIGEARYWLRTPFGRDYQYSVMDTYYSGYYVFTSDFDYGDVLAETAYMNFGVRPAFYFKETVAKIKSGSGTKSDPYVVGG